MRTSRLFQAAACLVFLVLLVLSCQTEKKYQVGQLVDPRITQVSADGKTAKVNIGVFDDLHGGQRLYVVRNDEVVGMVMVTMMADYSADCVVIASNEDTPAAGGAGYRPSNVRVGDRVAREFRHVLRTGTPGDKVPRMVPVPYNPDNSTGTITRLQVTVPREEYEQWKLKHPRMMITDKK